MKASNKRGVPVSLYRKRMGEGPPLIFLHGLFGMSDNWVTIGKRMASRHTVLLTDARNHGRSPHTEDMDYALMALDLRHLLEEEGLERVTLIGHSMGGKTAMQFLMDFPEFVERLIVVDIAPKAYPPGHQMIFDALQRVDLQTDRRGEIEAQLAKWVPTRAIAQFLMKNLQRDRAGGFEWKFNLPVLEAHYSELIGPIRWEGKRRQPTLIVKGEQSPYIIDGDMRTFSEVLPNSQLEVIQGAGHWVHAEQPKAFVMALDEFFTEKPKIFKGENAF